VDILHGRLHVTDLESTNGTFVNGVEISACYLEAGQVLRVGGTTLSVARDASVDEPALSKAESFGRVIGASVEMRRLYPLFERLAHVDVPLVIEGETGTGKEALAEALHELGPRAQGPFVVFDCTAVPANLMESELLGHERGAFTGAVTTRKGVFEQADGGTLFIDEIGDLDLPLQAKLLRAIERSEVRRVGGNVTLRVNVRVITATRRDLDRAVQEGRFRDDLFHRLAIARVELPPLRRRWGDVELLARKFWAALGGAAAALPSDVLARWNEHSWPGNVRELRNSVARQLALGHLGSQRSSARVGTMKTEPPASVSAGDPVARVLAEDLPFPIARRRVLDEFERLFVERLLTEHGGDTAKAAAAAGVARRYFQILQARKSKG
jgi:transcriptional regulator with GAF, ATPase, and Fis domain